MTNKSRSRMRPSRPTPLLMRARILGTTRLRMAKRARLQPRPTLKRPPHRPGDANELLREPARLADGEQLPRQSQENPLMVLRVMRVKMFLCPGFEICTETRSFLA